MKKAILAVALVAASTFANDVTVNATMSLMEQGINQVQKGFLYNSKSDIKAGISTLESANSIFNHVDVSTFIKHNNKVQVTKNINANLTADLKALKKDVNAGKFNDATKKYGKVVNDCLSCHTIIRGW
jgi:nitrate reductase cytochrome c-type subunit